MEDDLVRRALTPRIGEDAVLILVVVEDGLVLDIEYDAYWASWS